MANYDSLDSFMIALQKAKNGLLDSIASKVNTECNNLADKIKLRVIKTGANSDGGNFTPYSIGHKAKKAKSGRSPDGKTTSFKNFYYQGTMWDNFKVLMNNKSNDKITITLGFTGNNAYLSNDELNSIHSAKENSTPISKPSKDEEMEFINNIGNTIGDYLKSVL